MPTGELLGEEVTRPTQPVGWESARATHIRAAGAFVLLSELALLGACLPARPQAPAGSVQGVIGQYGGAITAVAVADGRAYLGAGRRLQVLDLTDESRPRLAAQSPAFPESVRAIATADHTVVVAAGGSGVAVYDVQDTTAITRVATLATTWSSYDVAIAGAHAYVAEGTRGLRVLDLTEPRRPRDIAQADTPGTALAVALGGSQAYVADWGMGVRVFDISDPANPREAAAVDTPGEAADVAFDGSYLFVADRRGGLRILDVRVPAAPAELAAVAIPGAERVAAADGRAYVATDAGGLHILDVRVPSRPRRLGLFGATAMPTDVATANGHVFVTDSGTAVAPARKAAGDLWLAFHMWGVDNRPEAAVGLAGLHIARPSESGLTAVSFYPSPSLIEAVAAHPREPILYLADGGAGIVVVDIARPQEPQLVGTLDTAGPANDVLMIEDRALVAAGSGGLLVLDLRDPRRPAIARVIDTPGEALGVASNGRLACVADGELGGLRIIDLRSYREVGSLDTPGMAWDVALRDDTAYVSDRSAALVVDVRDPAAPKIISSALYREGDVLELVPSNDIVWAAAGPAGLAALNGKDLAHPQTIGLLPMDDRAIGLAVTSRQAFVAAGASGLVEVDISAPRAARQLHVWPLAGAAERVLIHGRYAYVAAEMGGLQIVQLDPLGLDSSGE